MSTDSRYSAMKMGAAGNRSDNTTQIMIKGAVEVMRKISEGDDY